ncbi:MAG: hypothetical protein ACE5MM_00020 [Nitrospiraceae bacterium]
MVHALEEIHRLLRPDGYLIDIHPFVEGSFIEVLGEDEVLFAEPRRLTDDEDVVQAEAALTQVLKRRLFAVEDSDEFDFFTHASSVPELREFREEDSAYDDSPSDEALVAREEELYAQAEKILQASAEEAHIASHTRCRIARLRPVR